MSEYKIVLHLKDGNKIYTKTELIENAIEQEKDGVKPHYYLRNNKGGFFAGAGWLVYSTYQDGAGVVYKSENGNYNLVEGWQSDFVYN